METLRQRIPVRVGTSKSFTANMVVEYLALKSEVKEREERIEELRGVLLKETRAADGVLEIGDHKLTLEVRRSLSWSLDTVKDIFASKWTEYIEANSKLLRVRASEADAKGAMLMATASVKETEALRVE